MTQGGVERVNRIEGNETFENKETKEPRGLDRCARRDTEKAEVLGCRIK
jgi:hypothetical protein